MVSLITTSIKESSPARGESKHGFVLVGMREEGDEDEPLLRYLIEGARGLLLGDGFGPGCRLLLGCTMGCSTGYTAR
jgi:hypothetical protein